MIEDWSRLRTSIGPAGFVPAAVDRMLAAETAEEATVAYWELDNRVVIQGQLFEAAEATALQVAELLCRGRATQAGIARGLDLLVEIASGEADQSEVALDNADLGQRCRACLLPYIECLYSLGATMEDRVLLGVLDLLDLLDANRSRLASFASGVLASPVAVSDQVSNRAQELAG